MQSTEPTLWQRRWSVFSLISQSILNRFTCNFAHTIRSHCGDCPEYLVRFDRVFQKLLMWCTETTLFPHRQSAENAGRHWNSTEEVPSPHRTCVTEQLELTRQVARIEGGGPRVVVSTAAFHARVRGSVPGLGGLKETKKILPHPRVKVSIAGASVTER